MHNFRLSSLCLCYHVHNWAGLRRINSKITRSRFQQPANEINSFMENRQQISEAQKSRERIKGSGPWLKTKGKTRSHWPRPSLGLGIFQKKKNSYPGINRLCPQIPGWALIFRICDEGRFGEPQVHSWLHQ
jgi:hypothetical protein